MRNPAEELISIKAYKNQIDQILWGLYDNAFDAMPKKGKIYLETKNTTHESLKGRSYKVISGKYIYLRINDTGIGTDLKTQQRIFEPFFTTKPIDQSTGLGLASVYGIIKAHGCILKSSPKKTRRYRFVFFYQQTGTNS